MTKFSEIYERALWRVRDFEALVRDSKMSERMYFHLLLSAIADIQHYAPISLTFQKLEEECQECKVPQPLTTEGEEPPEDEPDQLPEYVFDEELSPELIDLLALGVAVKWLEPHFLNSDALKRGLYNKDYRDYGMDADKIAGMYHTMRRMFEGRARTMSFRHGNMQNLTTTPPRRR